MNGGLQKMFGDQSSSIEAQKSMDTRFSPGSQNAVLVESVVGGGEGYDDPSRLKRDGQVVDAAAAECGAASVDHCYLRVCGKALASEQHISLPSTQLPL